MFPFRQSRLRQKRNYGARFEPMEDRILLTSIVVNTDAVGAAAPTKLVATEMPEESRDGLYNARSEAPEGLLIILRS